MKNHTLNLLVLVFATSCGGAISPSSDSVDGGSIRANDAAPSVADAPAVNSKGVWRPMLIDQGVIEGGGGYQLESVWAVAPNNVWAVGAECTLCGSLPHGVIVHWDGAHWSRVSVFSG